jgi:hypothetical protein
MATQTTRSNVRVDYKCAPIAGLWRMLVCNSVMRGSSSKISTVASGRDIDQLPPQVRQVAQRSALVVTRLARRIARMSQSKRPEGYREAETTFRETAAANGLTELMVERYIRYIRQALRDAVAEIDSAGGPSGVA